jgi:lipopolysaccharide biosynthesis glycosyltransferase
VRAGYPSRALFVSETTQKLQDAGFDMSWLSPPSTMSGKWGVETPYIDAKHAAPLNLLRFNLPHLPSFSGVDKFIFLDDDIIVTKDIMTLWNFDLAPGKVMATGCQHWSWVAPGQFSSSTKMTVKETGYIGDLSSVCAVTAKEKLQTRSSCTRAGLEGDLGEASRMISEDSPFASRPLDRQAFNLGFSLIDSIAWKSAKVTEKFEKWVKVSFDQLLFPHDTLGFGLVLGYFALADAVECYDDKITHLVGLAFINDESFVAEGWTAKTIIEKSSALHYNGANKPWLEPAPPLYVAKTVP